MTASTEFEPHGELPTGRVVIEASAGTGKTHTLTTLAVRFLAERNLPTSDLLIVTFTRAATAELRDRCRRRIAAAVEHLDAVDRGGSPEATDPVLTHLAAGDVDLRLGRLRRALQEFDAATITTIHGFATQVLGTLGLAAGTDPDAAMVDDAAQLAAQCCADVLADAALRTGNPAALKGLKSSTLATRTRTALNIPDLRIAPSAHDPAAPADLLWAELIRRSIDRIAVQRRAMGTLSFDDVLRVLRDALGRSDATALRNRYQVALIDEFQDTDPVQWDIFESIFPDPLDPSSSLVLVGDPKQSIYSFRGANVHTYLRAVDGAPSPPRTLGTNWRSDGAVLEATAALFEGVTFGDAAIAFAPVQPIADHATRRLRTRSGEALPALDLRLTTVGITPAKSGELPAEPVRRALFADLVERVRALLDDAVLPDPVTDDADRTRSVLPSDIAVLVKSNKDAEAARDALRAQGVPAILSRGASVFESAAATQWRWLLHAMARPSDPARARAFALSWFGARSADWVAAADDDQLVELQEQLVGWSNVLATRGVVEFQQRLWHESDVTATVLARPDGDRELTDLEHVAELLCAGATAEHQSVAGLLSVLDASAPEEIDADAERDTLARRVESEAAAVKVMTVWVSKGLEFPIVCVPTLWSASTGDRIGPDPDGDVGDRMYDVAISKKKWPDKDTHAEREAAVAAEQRGESLRLLYVALTRARHQTIVWWAPCTRSARAGLTRVLAARDAQGRLDPVRFDDPATFKPKDTLATIAAPLHALAASTGGRIKVSPHGQPAAPSTRWSAPVPQEEQVELAVATPTRTPDRSRHRWSFTVLTAREREAHLDPTDATGGDAGAADEPPVDASDPLDPATPAPGALGPLPAGAAFGTVVHSVLEHVDFAADDTAEQLRRHVVDQLARSDVDPSPYLPEGGRGTRQQGIELLVDGLLDALHTPLGALFDDRPLTRVPRSDRLDEVSFDLRLGDAPSGLAATADEVGALIEAHLAPTSLLDQHPLHPWSEQLRAGRFDAVLAGHLTGSIDAVLRVPGADAPPRFVVVDYKTNRLTRRGAVPTVDDYAPDRLAGAMAEHHYPLQALLYSVALHRYLRWRLAGYDPAVHLGGIAYLFVRGMVGPDTPVTAGQRHGVFSWDVPPRLVTELSDLLAGRSTAGADPTRGNR
jgi:exodeoxyribonuclease V beta subunit